jgi:hypothetical protein
MINYTLTIKRHNQQALYWHQHDFVSDFSWQARHQFECNSHAQIFSENLMTCGFWNSNCLCYFMNSQMTIGIYHFPSLWMFSSFFLCWRLSQMFIVLNWSLALFNTFVPLVGLCSTHGFIPKHLFLRFESLLKSVFLIWNKISHKLVACENRLFLITEKFAQQARCVHSKRQSTMTKHTRMILFWALALGNSLLQSATSRTLLQLSVGMLI